MKKIEDKVISITKSTRSYVPTNLYALIIFNKDVINREQKRKRNEKYFRSFHNGKERRKKVRQTYFVLKRRRK